MRRFARVAGRIIDLMITVSALLAVVLLTVLMLLVSYNVFVRTFFDGNVRGLIEISEVLLVIAVYLSMPVTQRLGQHVSITVATARLTSNTQGVITRVGLAIAVAYVAVASWSGLERALVSVNAGESRWGLISVPIWPARIALAMGLALLALELTRQLFSRGGESAEGDVPIL